MNTRIKEIRKSFKLSRDDFGKRLGVSRDVIANIELERLAKPEQKEPLIKLVCKEFNVSYEWLTTGKGDMFVETKESLVERLSAEYGFSFYAGKILECYLGLESVQREAIDVFFKAFLEACNTVSAKDVDVDDILDDTIEALRARRNENNTEPENFSS